MHYTKADLQCDCTAPQKQGFLHGVHDCTCHTYRAIYPELVGYRCRGNEVPPPTFPDACPCCGAERVASNEGPTLLPFQAGVTYACGGRYDHKPQIQNHTEYFWGRCGLVK